MKMMSIKRFLLDLCIFNVILLTTPFFAYSAKMDIPACGSGTERVFMPTASAPVWAACKDKKGLYQGLLIQFSNQTEILRVANLKDSLRHGKEIRAGKQGFLEERHYQNGHLEKSSFVFKSDATLGRSMPTPMTDKDWKAFSEASDTSLLKDWIKQEPVSFTRFQNGRLVQLKFEKTDYTFTVSSDGRIFSNNHPDMKKMFFIDAETLWTLNAEDLKKALLPGFGSCKTYAGPIGRFTRHFDHVHFKREPSEVKQTAKLNTIRDRFIAFCVPKDILENLGSLECPPHLPTKRAPKFCAIPVSDQLHLPYEPKYFKNELTFGRTPEEFQTILLQHGLMKFLGDYDLQWQAMDLAPGVRIYIKKSAHGLLYKAVKKDKKGKFLMKEPTDADQDWWDWLGIPGYSTY